MMSKNIIFVLMYNRHKLLDLNSSSVSLVFVAPLKILTSRCLAMIRGYIYRHTGATILSRIRGSVINNCGY
jgi:hypothetical protein